MSSPLVSSSSVSSLLSSLASMQSKRCPGGMMLGKIGDPMMMLMVMVRYDDDQDDDDDDVQVVSMIYR